MSFLHFAISNFLDLVNTCVTYSVAPRPICSELHSYCASIFPTNLLSKYRQFSGLSGGKMSKTSTRYVSQTWGPVQVVFYTDKLSWFVSELPDISQTWQSSVQVLFYNKLSWFVSELPEKDILMWWSSVGSILQ